MQLAIYSGVSTLSLPVMLIAILKDGLEHVMPGLANVQHIPVYMCSICISQFPNVLYSMVANTLILYESEMKKKKYLNCLECVLGVFCLKQPFLYFGLL